MIYTAEEEDEAFKGDPGFRLEDLVIAQVKRATWGFVSA